MRLEIIKIEQKEYEEIHIYHIYPPNNRKEENLYRRHGPDYWTHWLGTRHQYIRYMEPELLEDAYQKFMRKANAKPKVVNK